ncbi:RNA ligase RtcB family protein [uncultured Microbulbifer sp.]|uniref:RNA ligase RtcB family protein n=1 Tax=uncultured Microbulbifer sp. TaxID=348147 RepID=UPI002624AE82|nr:RNA ligase RtcB family protein [uncultured Microbulbifer sp.]
MPKKSITFWITVRTMDTFSKKLADKSYYRKVDVVKTLQTSSQAAVRLVISDKNWLETLAVDQLKKTTELPGMCCGVGMPDLHPGKGQPIGAAFITRDQVYPHLVGSDIGCGMGLWKLDVTRRQVKLDKWEKRLVDLDDPWQGGDTDQWLSDSGVKTNDDSLKEANLKLGTIGGGNHFAEIQQVNEIFAHEVLSGLGLDKQSVVFLAHSGSRGLGQKILRNHVDVFGAQSLTNDAMARYLERHDYAVQWAVANRDLIAKRFCERLGVNRDALLDVSHNTVTAMDQQSIDALGLEYTSESRYWIHRKGASPTDQGLVMIPGSRGSLSYLVKPRASEAYNLAAGGFSLAHGAGRKWKRSESRGRLEKRYKVKDLEVTDLGSRVICKQRDLLYEEAPQAYKNISTVVDDLVQAGMVDVVASFKPLITYKTRKK